MYERLKDLPILDSYPSRVPAANWNTWRRYWSQTHRTACFGLEGLPPLSLLLDEREWVLLDTSAYDFPVLTWTEFQDEKRGLHEAVPCIVRHYHQGASRIRDKALLLMVEELDSRMKEARR
jgi:hypothetical protein